jgi:hypothetical protein
LGNSHKPSLELRLARRGVCKNPANPLEHAHLSV